MSLMKVFDIAGSGMSAQSVRLNTTASNLANADSVSGTADGVYKARNPVFQAIMNDFSADRSSVGVTVSEIQESNAAPRKMHQPDNPLADAEGYVYMPDVNAIEEMANMISASRSYQSNVEIMNTTKQLILRTLQIGQ
ncbi:Flagellar basal-body rod protein FlgC [hydrothermal vent metagenome]|uniref:Flagellar basal-body rod protein FlgC n=1 Tax=hydrothermal vent metagenome TaxID=652676 RepID=A0A3B0ZIK8_9ZZZZ